MHNSISGGKKKTPQYSIMHTHFGGKKERKKKDRKKEKIMQNGCSNLQETPLSCQLSSWKVHRHVKTEKVFNARISSQKYEINPYFVRLQTGLMHGNICNILEGSLKLLKLYWTSRVIRCLDTRHLGRIKSSSSKYFSVSLSLQPSTLTQKQGKHLKGSTVKKVEDILKEFCWNSCHLSLPSQGRGEEEIVFSLLMSFAFSSFFCSDN